MNPTAFDCTTWIVGDGHGTPWAKMHCGQLALAVLQAMGHDLVDADLWVGPDVGKGVELFDSYLSAHGSQWLRLGNTPQAAEQLGDIVISKALSGPAPIHLSVYVDTVVRKVLTTSLASGAMLMPIWSLSSILGVYRWKGATCAP